MKAAKVRILKLMACFTMFGCSLPQKLLLGYDCGCLGENSDMCKCSPFCNCGEEGGYSQKEENGAAGSGSCKAVKERGAALCKAEDCNLDCSSCSCCFINGFELGVDYLYWQPCVTGLQYAIEQKLTGTELLSKYEVKSVDHTSASGFRLNAAFLFTLEGLSLRAAYTDVGFHDGSSVFTGDLNLVSFSHGTPNEVQRFNRVKGHWEMKYQAVEAVLAYTLNLDSLAITPYGGVDTLAYDNRLISIGSSNVSEIAYALKIRKHQYYFGAGPMFGVGTSYDICDCFNAFVNINASLLIGRAEEEDHFRSHIGDSPVEAWHYKSDDCYCFPGWHLMLGVGYKTCICGYETALRVGYEFVQYTNAPWFQDFESDSCQVSASMNARNLTLRGLFAGVNITF